MSLCTYSQYLKMFSLQNRLIILYYKMQAHSWCEDHTTHKNLIGMVLIHWRCNYWSNFARCFTCNFEHFMMSFLWAQTTGNHMLNVIHTVPRTWISARIMKCDTCSEVGNIWPEETAVVSVQNEHNCCLHQKTKKQPNWTIITDPQYYKIVKLQWNLAKNMTN